LLFHLFSIFEIENRDSFVKQIGDKNISVFVSSDSIIEPISGFLLPDTFLSNFAIVDKGILKEKVG
jgi:hypothetical protein